MKSSIRILFLTLILVVSSCSSSFIVRTKKKTINLKTLPRNSIKVGLDNELVEIKFNRNDLIELLEQEQQEWSDPRIKSYIDELKSLESEKIYKKDRAVGNLPLAEYELRFHTLMLNGKAEIENKATKESLKRIKYKFTRDKLGGERASFLDASGKVIYEIVLALGE